MKFLSQLIFWGSVFVFTGCENCTKDYLLDIYLHKYTDGFAVSEAHCRTRPNAVFLCGVTNEHHANTDKFSKPDSLYLYISGHISESPQSKTERLAAVAKQASNGKQSPEFLTLTHDHNNASKVFDKRRPAPVWGSEFRKSDAVCPNMVMPKLVRIFNMDIDEDLYSYQRLV